MLSAFTARPIVELKPKEKIKIESILAFGNRLLVGLSNGSLRVYRVDEDSTGDKQNGRQCGAEGGEETPSSPINSHSVELVREVDKFASRAVQQLAIIKEANILVSLSDSSISIHDLQDYSPQEQITRTKGATTFAVTSNIVKEPLTGIPSIVSRLAVAVKRRLLIWSWHDTELSSDVIESSLASPAKTLTWASDAKLICGMGNGFVTLDIMSKTVSDIVGPGSIGGSAGQEGGRFGGVGSAGMGYIGMGSWVPKPLVTRLTDGELLLAKDINTLFIDNSGQPLDKRQIRWSVAPEAIAFSYPYLLALSSSSKGTLEVRNPDTRSLLQSIQLQNATQMHVPQPNVSLAHAGKGFLVASDRCIWRMGAEEYGAQIDQLVEKDQFDEAISLLGMLEDALIDDKDGRLRRVKMQKAQSLFDARKYRESLDLFTDVSAPPEKVVRLYPRSIAGDLSSVDDDNQSAEEAEETPDGKDQNGDATAEAPPEAVRRSQAVEKTSKNPAIASIKTGTRQGGSDTASIFSNKQPATPAPASDAGSISDRQSTTGTNQPDRALAGEDLHAAVSALCSFLADTRRRVQRYLNPDGSVKETLDSSSPNIDLFLLLAPPSASTGSSIRSDPDALHQRLLQTAQLVDTTLFKSYTLTRPSLASSLFRISNFCDPSVVNDALLASGRYAELVDFLHGKKLHRQALELLRKFGQGEMDETPEQLNGTRRTVAYLQSLARDDVDLVLEFAEWVLARDGEAGLEIFTADTENAETLPREKVEVFLKRLDSTSKRRRGLEQRYLEHVIDEWDDLTPSFHARLVTIYIQGLLHKDADEGEEAKEERTADMQTLIAFLKRSDHYSTAKALNLIPRQDPDFYEPRAIVLSKMGQHKQALEIYVFKLQDHAKAEEYCNHIYLSQPPSELSTSDTEPAPAPSIYHTLLALYLRPPPPYPLSLPPALSLLSRHGARLPPTSTLDLIPATLPVQELACYFRGRMRAGNSRLNGSKAEVGLRGSERIRARVGLVLGEGGRSAGRGRRVVVGEERVCGVCHRRLGGSAVAVLADNAVVHYGCLGRLGA